VTDHQLLLFLVELFALFLAARVGGEIATRAGLPSHVGEIVAGMLLGPSVLGSIAPGAFEELFPADPAQRALLDVVSWIGVLLLVLLAGLETSLGILRRAGRAALGASVGGFLLPFAAGLLLGAFAPDDLIPASIDRPVFATFLATALSISAIPVIARILSDLHLYRTAVGMVVLASALASDVLGWIVVSLVVGWAGGGTDAAAVARIAGLTAAFLVGAYVVGRPLVWALMFFVRDRIRSPSAELATMFLLVVGGAAITQAIGVHLVLGALVLAVFIGRTRRGSDPVPDGVTDVAAAFFAPVFFAYTGVKVDVTALSGVTLGFAAVAVVVACISKVVGGGLGARLGGMPKWEALAVGFGLNARGAMELVIAAIGLSIGILNDAGYAIVVLIAILTTIMAAPTLKVCIDRAGPQARERPRGPGRARAAAEVTAPVEPEPSTDPAA
jgi:Kef-type K+ transport system membrane component KefB